MKQVIIMRKDLTLRKGKMCAQAAHASVASIVGTIADNSAHAKIDKWLQDGMTKIVVGCNSEDELYQLAGKSRELGLITSLIKDAGMTEVEPGTPTCCAVGPDEDHLVDQVTAHLKLL